MDEIENDTNTGRNEGPPTFSDEGKGEAFLMNLLEAAMKNMHQGKWAEARADLLKIEALNPEGMYASVASEYLQQIIDQEQEKAGPA
ncbi:MAG: hypothetical protein COV74_03630 [Candidatus Omnitrophica bacterium CG11_big_fil_rev_8_21_14_0_20_45_26]|uniref:Uncharacterized protein n=1 Tax=Candidatus Abzuiibacterium crystallinum TaxID=1974748 RepID=A0A2H0LQK5_9BACT|nr:MAG: hypothetical protein COV74_03630 [Candidatus Omnitrophica bacterium CG11_big_fil_rev_8_21_14_0_20_45_26]PIW64457.1 MAG: hypothetical protein COW12_06115 [Candidatus Omnitrophica bacterium CG12_big_fil_rev_8_21_14_0_65_45_16]